LFRQGIAIIKNSTNDSHTIPIHYEEKETQKRTTTNFEVQNEIRWVRNSAMNFGLPSQFSAATETNFLLAIVFSFAGEINHIKKLVILLKNCNEDYCPGLRRKFHESFIKSSPEQEFANFIVVLDLLWTIALEDCEDATIISKCILDALLGAIVDTCVIEGKDGCLDACSQNQYTLYERFGQVSSLLKLFIRKVRIKITKSVGNRHSFDTWVIKNIGNRNIVLFHTKYKYFISYFSNCTHTT
jgi:hypothetical protein